MKRSKLEKVYLLETELLGDSFFSPSGLVIVWEKQKISLYCRDSSHNLFRGAIVRNSWADLEQGVPVRDLILRVRELTPEIMENGWEDTNKLPEIVQYICRKYPRHLHFLQHA